MTNAFLIKSLIFNEKDLCTNAYSSIQNSAQDGYLLLVDEKNHLTGVLSYISFLKMYPLARQSNWPLSTIKSMHFSVIQSKERIGISDLVSPNPIVIIENNSPLGILDKTAFLVDKIINNANDFSAENTYLYNAPFGFLIFDTVGTIKACNKKACELLSATHSPFEKSIHHYFSSKIKTKTDNWKEQITYRNRILEWDIHPQKKAALYAVYLTHITTIKKQQKDLNKAFSEIETLYDALDHSYDEIFIVDKKGTCTFINKVCEHFYGLPKSHFIGKSIQEIVNMGITSTAVLDVAFKKQKRETKIQTTSNGHYIIATANPIWDEQGQFKGMIMNARSVAELNNIVDLIDATVDNGSDVSIEKKLKKQLLSEQIVAQSESMKEIIEIIKKVSLVDSNILLLGESGVGKGVVAKLTHSLKYSKDSPFIKVNCGAIPDNLIESELFGYEKGAFTGANSAGKTGLIELANNGTLFLDEIGELPLHVQPTLLHAIQEKSFIRVGGKENISVNCRIIAATNKDLLKMVEEGKFREDLYYRLNVIPIIIPPLRKRKKDIPQLVQSTLERCNKKWNTAVVLTADCMEELVSYSWPGNIRELENVIERLVATATNNIIDVNLISMLLPNLNTNQKNGYANVNPTIDFSKITSLKDSVAEYEKKIIEWAIRENKTTYEAAKTLDVDQSTIVRKMQKYGLKL